MNDLRTLTLDLQATPEQLMHAVEQLQSFGRENEYDERMVYGLMLALEECGANVIHHAYRDQLHHRFQVSFTANLEQLMIELRDTGPPFDPTQYAVDEGSAEADDRPPGGWGIQLARRYLDEITYTRADNQNVLRMIKHCAKSIV